MTCDQVIRNTLNFLEGKKLLLFLDFDGTLAEVQEVADETYMDNDMKRLMQQIAQMRNEIITIAISGRKLEDLQSRVQLNNIIYSGNHGLEVKLEQDPVSYCMNEKDLAQLRRGVSNIKKGLETKNLGPARGGNIEDKDTALTWHYFKVPEDEVIDTVKQAVEVIKKEGFQIFEGVGCLEVRAAEITKGDAMKDIIHKKLGENWHEEYRALFLGDSFSDEEGYQALVKMPGFNSSNVQFVRVLPDPTKTTLAEWKVSSVDDVYHLLSAIKQHYSSQSC